MKAAIPLVILALSAASAQAPDTLWTRALDIHPFSRGQGIDITQDGGFVVAGSTRGHSNPDLGLYRLDGDGNVDASDLAILLGAWGPVELCPPYPSADLDQDCQVGPADLALLLGNWG